MKLAIGIPNTGTIKTQTVLSLFRMLKDFPHEYTILFKEGCAIHLNREKLVETAIEKGYTHLLFIDSDMSFEKGAVQRLLDHNKDIIGANYNKRQFPLISTAVSKPFQEGDLVKCETLGAGFLLINLDVFKKLSKPWFFWEKDGAGEDYWFCRKARELGYDVWVDYSIIIKHIGDYAF